MKISELYNLNKTQYELDFVDIDPSKDAPLFLDPYFISKGEFPLAREAYSYLRTYFEFLLALLRGNRIEEAKELFSHLGETNDLCLGMSKGKPQGHGMGPQDTDRIFESLYQSRALLTGVMDDIEDFRIFVPNVDKDKVSDMTANIIRRLLINYTKEQCELHGIPLVDDAPSGMFWDPRRKMWDNQYVSRLIIDNRPILLVPKRIVSFADKYTTKEYRQHFVLNFLQNEHLRLQTSLVQERQDGSQYVTKKSITETEAKMDKEYFARFTMQHPEVFAGFKNQTTNKLDCVNGEVLEELDVLAVCSFLSQKLQQTPSGTESATAYHNLIVGVLELLLYPNLSAPKKEVNIHEGRKRIDITYNNSAESGFFYTLPTQLPLLTCPYVFVECKNYSRKVSNPELDQLSGRFSPHRGRVGLLVCRGVDEQEEFTKRCADTYFDERGLVIPLFDEDLLTALMEFPVSKHHALEKIIQEKFEKIVFSK